MTIYAASNGDPFPNGGATAWNFANLGYQGTVSASNIITQYTTPSPNWYEATVNNSKENGAVIPAAKLSNGSQATYQVVGAGARYCCFAVNFPSAVAPTTSRVKIFEINGAWLTSVYVAIETSGDWAIYNAGGTTEDTASPGLSTSTVYWVLVQMDDSTDTLNVWLGEEMAGEPGLLDDPTSWSGSPILTATIADADAPTATCWVGPRALLGAGAGGLQMYYSNVVWMDDHPVQPREVFTLALTGDGTNTDWTGSYTDIDDPFTAMPTVAEFITYTPANTGNTHYQGATHDGCAAAGINADAEILAVLPHGTSNEAVTGAHTPSRWGYGLYYSGNHLGGTEGLGRSGTINNDRVVGWEIHNTAPGGGAWDQTVLDATEWEARFQDDAAGLMQFNIWSGSLLVVTERPTPVAPGGQKIMVVT